MVGVIFILAVIFKELFPFFDNFFLIQVAVRTRPFNAREKARNAKLIVEMSGTSTKITNPDVKNSFKKYFVKNKFIGRE